MSALPCELKTFSVTDEYERGRVERRVTCEMVVRAELKDGRAIEDAYVHSRFFNIDGRRYHLSHVSSEPAVFSNDHFLPKIDETGACGAEERLGGKVGGSTCKYRRPAKH